MSTVNGFQVGSETLKYNYESLENYNTPNFSSSSSKVYAIGDYVMYNGKLYKCTTATTGGTWNVNNWAEAILTDDVTEQKNALTPIRDGTDILVEQGYFPDAYKAVDLSFGTYKYKYIAADNVFEMDRDETTGTKVVSISMNDSGITLANRLITIADYPVCLLHVDTNIPQAANPKITINLYQSNGTTVNHDTNISIDAEAKDYIIDIAKIIADNNWRNDVYYVIHSYKADSYTYTEAPYIHASNYGFFTVEQAYNPNLKIKIENLMDNVEDLLDDVQELFSGITSANNLAYALEEKSATNAPITIKTVDGYLRDDGTYTGTSNFKSTVTEKIKCSQGDIFYYFGQSSDSVVTAMWFKADGTILSTQKVGDGSYAHQVFTAPENADTVIFTSYGAKSADYVLPLVVTQKTVYESPLSRKVWYPCGDSFTAGEFTGISDATFTSGKYAGKNKTYPYHIGNRTNVDVRRGSTSGETMATFNGGTVVFSDPNYAYGYKSIGADADYITLWFGINDSGRNIPIGTIDDATNTTFYGAWNVVLDDLTTKCTKAHIGIIVSNNLSATYVDAVIAIAKKWGLPYLDLNYDNNVPLMHYSLRPDASAEIKTKRNTQFAISSENHHPNLLAHEYESYFIEKWLLSL